VATLWELMQDCIPNDHSRQVHSRYYIEAVMSRSEAPGTVVDLGCGDGSSAPIFRKFKPEVRWIGVDIDRSESALLLQEEVIIYDGVHLPFEDNSVPLIYSNQVFEHVRHPEPLLREIRRVLMPNGIFIGSTSQLEPYHSWSLWSYTVYGFRVIVEDAGLTLIEVRPGIDGIALIQRQWNGRRPQDSQWFKKSPLNSQVDDWGAATGRRPALINARKLQFCGQFSFLARKPEAKQSELQRRLRAVIQLLPARWRRMLRNISLCLYRACSPTEMPGNRSCDLAPCGPGASRVPVVHSTRH
jgi:SAM-dependent methyltransferase